MQSGLPFNLDDLLHQRAIESSRVEFKATWDDLTEVAVVRTTCAFANDLLNLNGGYIVLGVEEKEGRPVLPPRGLSGDLDRLQKEIYGACKQIKPDYQPLIFVEHVNDKTLLILQCPGGDNRPYEAASKKGGSAYFVRQGSQSVEARDDTRRQLMELAAKIPFDDRRSLEGTLRDLSPTLVRRFLDEVKSRLADEPIDDTDLYRRLQIIRPINSHEVPRNIGLLFFNEDPDRFFRGARIEVVRFIDEVGDQLEEREFRGPLSEQVRACLDYLTSMTGIRVHKRADRPEADRIPAYPRDALREALINAVYHRGYDGPPEPIKVYLRQDRIEIISYPGPMAGIELKHFQPGVPFPPVPARNRRIGDFLKELRLAEARGTGILKIRKSMQENGSPPPEFDFNPERTYFQTTLAVSRHYVLATLNRSVLAADRQLKNPQLLELLRRAFQRQPGFQDLTTELVRYELALGRLPEARAALATFAEQREEGQDLTWPYFAAAHALLAYDKRDEALTVLREVPSELVSPDEYLEYARLLREAGDIYGSYPFFEQAHSMPGKSATVRAEFAKIKLRIADDLDQGAKEQLRWEAVELLREAGPLWQYDTHDDAWDRPEAEGYSLLAQTLERLGMPLEEIDGAFQHALALVINEHEELAIRAEYEAWKQRTAPARRLRAKRPS